MLHVLFHLASDFLDSGLSRDSSPLALCLVQFHGLRVHLSLFELFRVDGREVNLFLGNEACIRLLGVYVVGCVSWKAIKHVSLWHYHRCGHITRVTPTVRNHVIMYTQETFFGVAREHVGISLQNWFNPDPKHFDFRLEKCGIHLQFNVHEFRNVFFGPVAERFTLSHYINVWLPKRGVSLQLVRKNKQGNEQHLWFIIHIIHIPEKV